jgi:hypothetical protein
MASPAWHREFSCVASLLLSVHCAQATAREGTTQFITSTFHPETVEVAAQCYGVYCKDKVRGSHLSGAGAFAYVCACACVRVHIAYRHVIRQRSSAQCTVAALHCR